MCIHAAFQCAAVMQCYNLRQGIMDTGSLVGWVRHKATRCSSKHNACHAVARYSHPLKVLKEGIALLALACPGIWMFAKHHHDNEPVVQSERHLCTAFCYRANKLAVWHQLSQPFYASQLYIWVQICAL